MKTSLIIFLFVLTMFLGGSAQFVSAQVSVDSTVLLDPVVISSKLAMSASNMSGCSFNLSRLTADNVQAIKDVSLSVPNLYMPDYGSRMTSAIYVRGMGARMDQPVVGLLVDGLPVFNKNNFDGKWGDISEITVLRGPQSALFGRNTMGGMFSVRTLSPKEFQGTKAQLEVANGTTMNASFSHYKKLKNALYLSVSGYGGHSDGLFTNTYNNSSCDSYNEAGGRAKLEWGEGNTNYLNNLLVSWVDQNGYPYRQLVNGELQPVRYNAPSAYERFHLNEGFHFIRKTGDKEWNSATTYQYTNDCMDLDQDFTDTDYFTLRQSQVEHLISEDLTLQSGKGSCWLRLTGMNLFLRHLVTDAPVTFMRAGIDTLILANANKGIQSAFPGGAIEISDLSFPLYSKFTQPSIGIALYHQSAVQHGNWTFHAGIRLDYESSWLKYRNASDLHYRFNMTMQDFRLIETRMSGTESVSFFEVLPSLAATWIPTKKIQLSASVSKGFKSGGFNTQLFSDILKNEVMDDMMRDMGVYISSAHTNYSVADVVAYKPENSWNYELKAELFPAEKLKMALAGFYIDCRDQQLTVFPSGQNTGRMMTNAGRTRSVGAELESSYQTRYYTVHVEYGYTNARFVKYNNGLEDYAGKRIPFVPENTFHASVDRRFKMERGILDYAVLHLGYRGCGRIWWTESNDVCQKYYGMFDASVTFSKNRWSLQCWSKNLTNTDYNTFYFVSMGNTFLQKGRPVQVGVTLKWTFIH